jgi:hypothetical protein
VGIENNTERNLKNLEEMPGNAKSLKRNNRKFKGILIGPPMALPSIFLMDGHLAKTHGGKKGQIPPMIRFRFSFQRHG